MLDTDLIMRACAINTLTRSSLVVKIIYTHTHIYIYILDGPGSNPGGDEIFRPSRPALGLTQPPIKWVPGLSRG